MKARKRIYDAILAEHLATNRQMAFVSGPEWATDRHSWENMPELTLLEWSTVHERTRVYYEQYRAVLEADVGHRDFSQMEREIAQTRRVLDSGSYRGEHREEGLGPQYVAHEAADSSPDPTD